MGWAARLAPFSLRALLGMAPSDLVLPVFQKE